MLRYEEDMEAIIVLRNTAVGDFFDLFFCLKGCGGVLVFFHAHFGNTHIERKLF